MVRKCCENSTNKISYNVSQSTELVLEKQFMTLLQDNDDNDADAGEDDAFSEARILKSNPSNTHLRRKRGILDESSINFPPEAALMSINFLTFSVFLIKLVLVKKQKKKRVLIMVFKIKFRYFSSFIYSR